MNQILIACLVFVAALAATLHHRQAARLAATELSRLKKKWRKEWEAERQAEDDRENAGVLDELDAMIDRMRDQHLAKMTPRTRALYEAYQAAEAEDKAAGRTAWTEAEWHEVVGADGGEDEGGSDARALPGPGVDGG